MKCTLYCSLPWHCLHNCLVLCTSDPSIPHHPASIYVAVEPSHIFMCAQRLPTIWSEPTPCHRATGDPHHRSEMPRLSIQTYDLPA
eukprot:Gb_28062 [translate_table: standard]